MSVFFRKNTKLRNILRGHYEFIDISVEFLFSI